MLDGKTPDYYEFLQISPHADSETIHRVYRFLAARFHPDNPASGDPEKFFLLKAAYDVLSDPDRRSEYDREHSQDERPVQTPLSNSVDFMDQVQGEVNRRLAVLSVLYFSRRSNPFAPEVSLADIEKRMGFPRDYLDFTTWYLVKKGYITRADNSDFALTADGVDYIETQRLNMPVLNKLLTNGNTPCTVDDDDEAALTPGNTPNPDRRRHTKERRVGSHDLRGEKFERRVNQRGRRATEQQPISGAPA
jgi:curved DNA-binding protein